MPLRNGKEYLKQPLKYPLCNNCHKFYSSPSFQYKCSSCFGFTPKTDQNGGAIGLNEWVKKIQ